MQTLLFFGDIVGRPGRNLLLSRLPALREEWKPDFVVANAENAAGGAGLTAALARELLEGGVDALTLGDHIWDQKGFVAEIDALEQVCRPANLPPDNPGRRSLVLERNGVKLGLFTVLGRNFMPPRDCPFRAADAVVEDLAGRTDLILAEIHAEATSEKIALGWHLDGKVTSVVGTHTHVQTADARLLHHGTAYITDVGMSGPYDSVLGREKEPVVQRFLDGLPRRFAVASGDVRLSGVLIKADEATGRALSIERVTVS